MVEAGVRGACIAHGPANIIALASMDKMCASVDDGVNCVRALAVPPWCRRNTPCSQTDICGDCLSPDCICCQILVTRFSRIPGRIKIVLCAEKLGF